MDTLAARPVWASLKGNEMKSFALVAMVSVAGVANIANAQDGDTADKGFYIGAGVGHSDLRLKSPEFGQGSTDETGFKVIGGYQFYPNFAVEVAYFKPGKFSEAEDGESLTLDVDTVQAFGVGRFPIAGPVWGFAKAGLTRWSADLTGSANGRTGTLSDDGTDFTFAFGAEARFNDQLSATVQIEQTTIDAPVVDIPVEWRLRFLSASILYRF